MNKLEIAKEAVKIHFDYPELTIKECVEKAERIYRMKKKKGN